MEWIKSLTELKSKRNLFQSTFMEEFYDTKGIFKETLPQKLMNTLFK